MATVYVIHAPSDRGVVTSTLLRPLPSLGFGRWLPATRRNAKDLARCPAVVVVVSSAAAQRAAVRQLTAAALRAAPIVIPIRLDETPFEAIVPRLATLPAIDLSGAPKDGAGDRSSTLRARLPELLPPVAGRGSRLGLPIEWDEEGFSDYLQSAVARHDHSRGSALLDALALHVRGRKLPYPVSYARFDLKGMRTKRQFQLMERYARLVLDSGTRDWQVERQLGQALIELGRYADALDVLRAIVEDAPPTHRESIEARGLIGRARKQRYVNQPGPSRASVLRSAFLTYARVHDAAPRELWHGINAVSILQRAHRDGLPWGDDVAARTRAEAILATLRDMGNKVDVWDRATRVEALVALGRFQEAEIALGEYLADPRMDAFEVSSTFRQFDEVLQLGRPGPGQHLHARLMAAADRFRAGGAALLPASRGDADTSGGQAILIRVADPDWQPLDTTGLTIGARLGTVLSARATPEAIRALLKDPRAVSIEESWPADEVLECKAGLPCVRVLVQEQYSDTGGTFEEDGSGALVACIDNGIDVLHEAFLDAAGTTTRIRAIWDQRSKPGVAGRTPAGAHPDRYAGLDYGRFYSHDEIQAMVAARAVQNGLDRNPGPAAGPNAPGRPGHGTHVASIAAGRGTTGFFRGVAPGAGLVIVIAKPDGEIGYSKAHIDALQFISATATHEGRPVAVNVSMGMNGGAHDGQSALEVAFNEFSNGGRSPGRVIVKSSGNEGVFRRHARFSAGKVEALTWVRGGPDPLHTGCERIELWWNSANTLSFRLEAPGGAVSPVIDEKTPEANATLGDTKYTMQLIKRHVDNGDSVLRIELGRGKTGVAAGTWKLTVTPASILTDSFVHAWIAAVSGRPSDFEAPFADGGHTLTVPGTAQSVITVGAMSVADPDTRPGFSSRGPTRDGRFKPDVVAPGVRVVAAMSGTSDGAGAEDGTSMAAPFVTGAVALVLSRAARRGGVPIPSANQIRAALIQKAQRKDAALTYDPWRGYGVLDVAALLAAF